MKRRLEPVVFLCLLALVAGCGRGGPSGYTVSGRITNSATGQGIGRVVLSFGTSGTVETKSDGTWTKSGLSGSLAVTPARLGWTFDPASRTVNGASSSVDFSGTAVGGASGPGSYADPNVTVPAFASDGSASFSVSTGSADSIGWVALFVQTTTEGAYPWAFVSQPSGHLTRGSKSPVRQRTLPGAPPLVPFRSGVEDQFSERLRQADLESIRHREAILAKSRSVTRVVCEQVGDTRSFFKQDADTGGWLSVSATVKAVGTWCVIYVDDASPVDQATVGDFRTAFDAFRPAITKAFGTELDEDGNGKVVILMTPLPHTGGGTLYGYFSSINEWPVSSHPYSNGCDMVYINSQAVVNDPFGLKGVVAHEYQHLLYFSERLRNGGPMNDAWLNEAFSMLASDLAGYGYRAGGAKDTARVHAWLASTASWSLLDWRPDAVSYGGLYLFGRYLYDHYGDSGTLKISRSMFGGMKAVTDVTGGTFGEVFRSFAGSLAYLFFQTSSPDSRLCFPSMIDLSPGPAGCLVTAETASSASGTLRPYGLQYFFLTGGGPHTRMNIALATNNLGNFGAIAVTGF